MVVFEAVVDKDVFASWLRNSLAWFQLQYYISIFFQVVYVAPMKALAAEMVRNFGKRLESLGVVVRELTGDMQLSKAEIMKTHVSLFL